MTSPLDPLFLALAQPVLRGPMGQALTVVPGDGEAPIAVRPWPRDAQGQPVRAWAHGAPHDDWPWLATERDILVLVSGHRPLTIAPATAWGHGGTPPDAPYPAVVGARVGGLAVFFVNGARQVRVFAADEAQAVELAPVDNAQIYAAWEADGRLWTAGMVARPSDDDGGIIDFGEALLLRWATRPLAVEARWQGRDLWPVDESVTSAAGWAGMLGVEAWLARQPGVAPGTQWLLGTPLTRGVHDLPAETSPFWMLGPPAPDDYHATVVARVDTTGAPVLTPPLALTRLLAGHSLVGTCCEDTHASRALVFTLAQSGVRTATVEHLHVSVWDGVAEQFGTPQPLAIHGLPAKAGTCTLLDFDAVHDPRFGHAATLAWQPQGKGPGAPLPVPWGVLLHSSDGQNWRAVQSLTADNCR